MTEPEGDRRELSEADKAKLLAAWKKMLVAAANAEQATVPVFVGDNDTFVQNRTGVLFRIEESHFLITAAHYVEGMAVGRTPIWLPPSTRGTPPISLGGRVVGAEQEAIDIAVIQLDAAVVAALVPARTFIGLSDMDLSRAPTTGLFVILGYPGSYSTVDFQQGKVRTRLLRYTASIYDGEVATFPMYDPNIHVLLSHQFLGHDTEGQPLMAPAMEGMSGGGIWRLTKLKSGWGKNWKPEDIQLVGIQNQYLPETYCVGSWIWYAVRLIWEKFPELRPAIELHARGLII
jgi:hypothetical protein